MKRSYTFIITKGVDGYYIASVPELPGVMTQAKTIAEIFPRVKEAIEAYLEAVRQENQSILDEVEFIGVNQIEVEMG
ncbi:MAG: type II toxin-antitoxin system HicB family antitoxin [Tepidanaerobacter acetatoxydans]|jgi:predicted RNase H-like HicB family nuclease|uniref:type II toxin-antitoxin system HicB family antitoxin n=1 Tax=Tepidanaerobacter acetatoxydans TaxID=499229 RepID=UPI0026ED6D3B|nr:type II toxin-antitoxin system HicB family antitoxin [Tepidanaerobacter acetatoxydans]NLU09772.1 type II toxin-antitoxin system HicB family antitoxin [Tepidanaerobacter acetatoxydans]